MTPEGERAHGGSRRRAVRPRCSAERPRPNVHRLRASRRRRREHGRHGSDRREFRRRARPAAAQRAQSRAGAVAQPRPLRGEGVYVARLDADDACRPTRLARQVEILDAEPRVGLVGTWMEAIDERGRTLGALEKRLDDYVDFVYHTLIMRVYVSHPVRDVPASARARARRLRRGDRSGRGQGPLAEARARAIRSAHRSRAARALPAARPAALPDARGIPAPGGRGEPGPLHRGARTRRVRRRPCGCCSPETRRRGRTTHTPCCNGVERVLDGARARLSLENDDAGRLHDLVARRLLEVSRLRPWHPHTRVVADYAIERLPPPDRAAARRRRRLSLVVAPTVTGARCRRRAAPPFRRCPARPRSGAHRLRGASTDVRWAADDTRRRDGASREGGGRGPLRTVDCAQHPARRRPVHHLAGAGGRRGEAPPRHAGGSRRLRGIAPRGSRARSRLPRGHVRARARSARR